MANSQEKLIREFETIKTMELHAYDVYVHLLPEIKDEEDKVVLEKIIKDEERHASMVQNIIDILKE